MKSTGIVIRIDKEGKVPIPWYIRKAIGIKKDEPLEIFLEKGKIIFIPYRPEK